MNRYSKIEYVKRKREIVLLVGRPCFWSKCTFCDYIEDNSYDESYASKVNSEALSLVTGEYGVLECINSGSVFELPKETLAEVKRLATDKNIKTLIFEAHYAFKNRLSEIKEFFHGFEVLFKTGVETFDNDFREDVLNKNAKFKDVLEVEEAFDSVCLLVGIKGQTKDMIDRDMEIAKNHFKWITVNVFINNRTSVKRDEELVKWFLEKYNWIKNDPHFEILEENTDFGVGEIS